MKALVCCIAMVLLFAGCAQQNKKQKPRIVHTHKKSSGLLIIPTKELSVLSDTSDTYAFLLPSKTKKIKKLSAKEQVRQIEARLVDIPIPVSVKPVSVSLGDRGCKLLSYTSTMSVKEIKRFYIQEMERFGWRQEYYFEGQELLLSFKKPDRFCSISVRPTRKNWDTSKNVLLNLFVS